MASSRSRLRVVFRRLVLTSLPLAGLAGCGGTQTVPVPCPQPVLVLADAGTPPDLPSECTACRGGPAICFAADAGYNDCRCALFTGRRPAGLAQVEAAQCDDALGAYLAEAAQLEAASVHAFRRLGRELAQHGAPRRLVQAAARAARDEVRHAQVTAQLARRHGALPAKARVAPAQARSLEALALENAVEGCVRESWGALLATWQAGTARDAELRAALRGIARDETRHAELAQEVAAWAEPQLSGPARARLAQARAQALHELWHEAQREPSPDLASRAGVPSAAVAQALFSGFRRDLQATCFA